MNKTLELHLFFDRIMMEHAFFLNIAFLDKDIELKRTATTFYNSFSLILEEAINLANGNISSDFLNSSIAYTPYTLQAEEKTSKLSGFNLKTNITILENNLNKVTKSIFLLSNRISLLNKKIIPILNSFIEFQEQILDRVLKCNLYTNNYPLFLIHIINEARMYQKTLTIIETHQMLSDKSLLEQELFWNDIMKEHALFIRGELDPTENINILEANKFSKEFEEILDKYSNNPNYLYKESLKELIAFQNFNLAGLEGIINCKIKSVILPLLADHVFREGNYYYRILKNNNIEFL